jgi:hypothetical protein
VRARENLPPHPPPPPPPPPCALPQVSGCVKHYVFNNEETDRSGMSANVPDRAAKELYYKLVSSAQTTRETRSVSRAP